MTVIEAESADNPGWVWREMYRPGGRGGRSCHRRPPMQYVPALAVLAEVTPPSGVPVRAAPSSAAHNVGAEWSPADCHPVWRCHSWMMTCYHHQTVGSHFSWRLQWIYYWSERLPSQFSLVSVEDPEVKASSWQGGGIHGLSRSSSGADHHSGRSHYRCRLFSRAAAQEGAGLRAGTPPLCPGLPALLVACASPLAGRSSSRLAWRRGRLFAEKS